jgi:two-component system, chemotaxis family, protein-glutamate methylesterase/glutaminase
MFSGLMERSGVKTLEARALGARDYLSKPENLGSVSVAMQKIRDELIPNIKILCAKKAGVEISYTLVPKPKTKVSAQFKNPAVARKTLNQKVDILGIGISTERPNTLAELIPTLLNETSCRSTDIKIPIGCS